MAVPVAATGDAVLFSPSEEVACAATELSDVEEVVVSVEAAV